MVIHMPLAELDLKRFALEVIGGIIGGFISEQAVKRPELMGLLGEYATPVAGVVVGLLGQYLGTKGTLPAEIAFMLEIAGAVTTGNWIYEELVKSTGGTSTRTVVPSGTGAQVIYIPPEEVKKKEVEEKYESLVV